MIDRALATIETNGRGTEGGPGYVWKDRASPCVLSCGKASNLSVASLWKRRLGEATWCCMLCPTRCKPPWTKLRAMEALRTHNMLWGIKFIHTPEIIADAYANSLRWRKHTWGLANQHFVPSRYGGDFYMNYVDAQQRWFFNQSSLELPRLYIYNHVCC
jgi:hypothetical protein